MFQEEEREKRQKLNFANSLYEAYAILGWDTGSAKDLDTFLNNFLKYGTLPGINSTDVQGGLLTTITWQFPNISLIQPKDRFRKKAPEMWMIIALTGNSKIIEKYARDYPDFAKSYQESYPYNYNPVYYAALAGDLEAVKYCVENLHIKVYHWDEIFEPSGVKVNEPIKQYLGEAYEKTQQEEAKAAQDRKEVQAHASTHQRSQKQAEKLTKGFDPNGENVAKQLAKIFHDYAHPGIFSLNWRHGSNQKVADQISKTLNENSTWTLEDCDKYIRSAIKPIEGKVNKWGTFQAVLDRVLPKQESKEPKDETLQIVP